ncbi:MAG: hypothetical protein AAGC67_01455 [Myxococcota bacterium]
MSARGMAVGVAGASVLLAGLLYVGVADLPEGLQCVAAIGILLAGWVIATRLRGKAAPPAEARDVGFEKKLAIGVGAGVIVLVLLIELWR